MALERFMNLQHTLPIVLFIYSYQRFGRVLQQMVIKPYGTVQFENDNYNILCLPHPARLTLNGTKKIAHIFNSNICLVLLLAGTKHSHTGSLSNFDNFLLIICNFVSLFSQIFIIKIIVAESVI